MASEPITSPMMNIPAPQSGGAGNSSSTAAKPAAKPAGAPKSSFADELAKADQADSAQPKAKAPAADRQAAPDKPKAPGNDKDGKDKPQADAANKAQDTAKKLAPLKKAASSSKQAIDDAPVVAFLTGHLEKVQPTEIPGLVSGNAFVADALGESDVASFMNKPATIGDILDDLDLPKGLADIAEQMGLDLSEKVTPSELLRAIGVDPGRVAAELTNLKTSLGAEGLVPYMRKAAQLAERNAAPEQPLEPYPGWSKSTTPPAVPQTPVTGSFDPSKVSTQGTGVTPTLPTTKVAGPAATVPTPEAHPAGIVSQEDLRRLVEQNPLASAGMTPQQLLKMLTPGMAADAVKKPGKDEAKLSPGAQQLSGLGSLGTSQFNPSDLAMAQSMPSLDLAGGAAPEMNRATFDAFSLLGDKLKATDTQSVDMTKAAPAQMPQVGDLTTKQAAPSSRSLEELLTAPKAALDGKPVAALGQPNKAVNLMPESALAQAKPKLEVKPEDLTQVAPSDVTDRIAAKPTVFAAAPEIIKDVQPRQVQMNLAQAIPADELRLTAPVRAGKGGDPGAQDFGGQGNKDDGKKQDLGGSSPFELSALKSHGVHFRDHVASQANAASDVGLTSEQRLDMFQRVMDRATSLMKDGGGVVRLDFSSHGLGQLEMAVKMDNDKMDLKILTGSERVKEAMMSELGRLRDALSVQNVQLGQVDVAVGGRQHQPSQQGFNFSQGSGQQAFQQQQQQRQAPRFDLESFAELRRPPMPAFQASQLLNSNAGTGRIAVRV